MWEFLSANPWALPATAGAVFGCLIPITAIVTDHQRKVRQAELDNELKHDLLSQGKDAKEIQAILEASSDRGPWWARQTQPR
ncbi:MAG: hypothetical protein AAF961_00170 [Planctomycetota bacterium]